MSTCGSRQLELLGPLVFGELQPDILLPPQALDLPKEPELLAVLLNAPGKLDIGLPQLADNLFRPVPIRGQPIAFFHLRSCCSGWCRSRNQGQLVEWLDEQRRRLQETLLTAYQNRHLPPVVLG